jgi:hypothetical protein
MSEQVDVEGLRDWVRSFPETAPLAVAINAAAAEITALRDALDKETKGQYSQLMLDAADAISAARHMRTVEIPDLRARAEAAEADAARYRWLRQWVTKPNDMPAMPEPETVEQFDAAIDAAMSERKEKP